MAWPVIAIKLLLIKFFKGAILGLFRYLHRVFSREENKDGEKEPMSVSQIKHKASRKENLIYLLLMIGNLFYGLQELLVIVWGIVLRRYRYQYFTGLPSAFEWPHDFCERVSELRWKKVWREIFRWFAIAGLVYWPGKQKEELHVNPSQKKFWLEVRWKHRLYMVKTHQARTVEIDDLKIVDFGNGSVEISVTSNAHVPPVNSEFHWQD